MEDIQETHEISRHDIVYDGMVWNIVSDTFDYHGEPLTREYVQHTGAVAIVARNADGEIATIRQYRHPVRERMVEVPAGLLDVAGEPPVEAAKRELLEEANLVAEHWTPIISYYSSPGGSSELLHVYLAEDISEGQTDFVREAEEADLEVKWVPQEELLFGIFNGQLKSPTLVVGVLALSARPHA